MPRAARGRKGPPSTRDEASHIPIRLPEYSHAEFVAIHEIANELAVAKSPLLQGVTRQKSISVATSRNTLPSGIIVDSEPLTVVSEVVEPIETAAGADRASLVRVLDDMSDQLAEQIVGWMFANLDRLLTAAGQVTDAKGQLDNNILLDAMESMQLSFNADGTWKPPTIVAGTEAAKKFAELPPFTTEQQQRLVSLIKQQRERYFASRGRRRISRNAI